MPQDVLPPSVYQEVRKCARCKKLKTFLRTENFKTCAECRKSARNYKRVRKPLKLSKEDIEQIEKENARKTRILGLKFGTDKPDCLEFRSEFSKGQMSDFLFNHVEYCRSCASWYARNKLDALNLNDVKEESKDGYTETFSEKKPFPEDFIYSNGGVFPLNSVCAECGTPLIKGKCPKCEYVPD